MNDHTPEPTACPNCGSPLIYQAEHECCKCEGGELPEDHEGECDCGHAWPSADDPWVCDGCGAERKGLVQDS